MQTIESELGCKVSDVFLDLSKDPIAAASLGQVYKGTLRSDGSVVAVKVQRPFVLETVSLDLYLMREAAQLAVKIPNSRTDWIGLLDEFAPRFYGELDYVLEGRNGERFVEIMKDIKQVVVPKTYMQYTKRRVHVAEWVEGIKLSQSQSDDVQDLVSVGMIAYLTQLLESGFFHADPHPGNMLRTPEGKLAILDFGLMTQVTDNQKYGMIEAIAHLLQRDYSVRCTTALDNIGRYNTSANQYGTSPVRYSTSTVQHQSVYHKYTKRQVRNCLYTQSSRD